MFIASSTNTHAHHLRRAASASLPVLCEKPIDLDFARAADVVSISPYDQRIIAMVDFNRRFDRDYAELRRVVATGGVGDVQLIQMTSRGLFAVPARVHRRVLRTTMRDQTVHFFDLARWIAEEEPEAVFARCSALIEPRLREYGVC